VKVVRRLLIVVAGMWALARPAFADDSLSIIAGNPTPGIFDTLELIAAGAGFYRAEHLNVTKDYAGGPAIAAQLVATGKADIASLSIEPLLAGYEKGLHLQLFLARQARYSYVLGVLADSPIRTLADFKGATLGEPNPGSSAEVAAQSMLAGAGLKRSDYSFLPIGIGAQALSAIVDKRVDGVAMPDLEIVNDTIAGHVTFRLFRHPILRDIPNVGYAATPATIQAKADALGRFSRAIVEAALFVRINPAAAARLYLQGSGQKVTADALRNTTRVLTLLQDDFPAANPANPRIGLMSSKNVQLYGTYMADYGMLHAPIPASIATDQFIAFANDFNHQALENFARSFGK
jgi:NitT/TauT family transport system substrate-binding protein